MGNQFLSNEPHRVLWFTGLSGSGKSTLAHELAKVLRKRKFVVEIIDGDQFRNRMHSNLGFSPQEIKLNNQIIINYCRSNLARNNFILVCVIAPFEETRLLARKTFSKNYIEVFCKAPLKVCIERDPKGLYRRGLEGKVKNLIGVDKNVPYEIPKHPDITINTDKLSIKESLQEILKFLNQKFHEQAHQNN